MLACFYHWYTSALYAAPPLAIIGAIWYQGRHDDESEPDDVNAAH